MDEEKKQKIMYWLAEVAICSHTFIDRPEHPEMKKEYMSLAVGILIGAILYENNRKMRSIGVLNVIDTSEGIQMALALDSEVKEFVNKEYVILQVRNRKA